MAVVQILAFLLAVLGIAKKFQLKFVEAVPIGTSLLVMLLYGLSFFRALSLSDYLFALLGKPGYEDMTEALLKRL